MANSNVRFLGYESDEKVAEYLGKASGFVCVEEEDFGIAIVEAQAAGCPVIAYGRGGALETVVEGETGLFVEEQEQGSLIDAIQKFERMRGDFHVENIVHNVQKFHKPRFIEEFRGFVEGNHGSGL